MKCWRLSKLMLFFSGIEEPRWGAISPELSLARVWDIFKWTAFILQWHSRLAKNALKELSSCFVLSFFLPTVVMNSLRNLFSSWSHFVYFPCLAFQKKKFVEQSNIVFLLFLGVFTSLPSMKSFTDESSLWKRLARFQGIFLKKNSPKLLRNVLFVSQEERRASDTVLFELKVPLWRKFHLFYRSHFKAYTSSLYEKKNVVYYFQKPLFVPEIFKFSQYAN